MLCASMIWLLKGTVVVNLAQSLTHLIPDICLAFGTWMNWSTHAGSR